jgi:hypothetical protein
MALAAPRVSAAELSRELARRIDPSTGPALRVVGVEHEFSLWRDRGFLDFRPFAPGLARFGQPWHPTDPLVFRCPDGLQLQADANVAELATPPVELAPGFDAALVEWTARGRQRLAGACPPDVTLKGESTHISLACEPGSVRGTALRFLQTFAPALMLVMDSRDSPGLLVRPRPGRLELCGEHVCGERLAAVLALMLGAVRALESAGDELSLPFLEVEVEAARGRFGWFVGKDAFSEGMYGAGRRSLLRTVDGTSISAQDHLEAVWVVVRPHIDGLVSPSVVSRLDAIVRGDDALGVELADDGECDCASVTAVGSSPFPAPPEARLHARIRPGYVLRVEVATWDFVAFRADGLARSLVAVTPRERLEPYLRLLDGGALDDLIQTALESELHSGPLRLAADTQSPGLFDSIVRSTELLPRDIMGVGPVPLRPLAAVGRVLANLAPAEIDAAGVTTNATAPPVPSALQPEQRAPKGTAPPPLPPATDAAWWRRWLVPGLAAAVLAIVAFVAAQALAGGDEREPDSTVQSPAAQASPASAPAETAASGAAEPDEEENVSLSDFERIAEFFAAHGAPAPGAGRFTFGSDGRPVPDAPPIDWADSLQVVVLIDANNLVWVAIEGPTSLLASACGEVDVIVGRGQHVGTGVDFCPEDAPAPSYFTDIVRYAVDDEGERARIVVRSEQLLAEPDGRISVWTLLVAEDGSYQAIESIGQGRALQAVDLGELSQSTGPAVMTGAAPEGGASTPDDLPPGLVPPSSSVAFVGTATGSRLVRFTSTATIEDIRAFYSSMLGEPDAAPGDQSPIWFTDGPTGIITVNLTGTDGSATVDVVLYDPVSSSN